MEDRNVLETEVLDETPEVISDELLVYLEKDGEVLEKLDGVIGSLEDELVSLNNEKDESEREFEARLEEFKNQLTEEKEAAFNDFSQRENDILEQKDFVEKLKFEQQGKQVDYIEALNTISSEYQSKISTIEEAIKTCEDNESLSNALDEEYSKMEDTLNEAYNIRKEELKEVLAAIGEEEEENTEATEESDFDESEEPTSEDTEEPTFDETEEQTYEDTEEPEVTEESEESDTEDYNIPEIDLPDLEPTLETPIDDNINMYNEEYDTEVVEHEPRRDVINVIYQSEDVMEGHVFPFLRSLM